MQAHDSSSRLPRQRWGVAVLIVLVAIAAALRVLDWPSRYEVRDFDEAGYLCSSLVLVEGITPGFKPAPAGPSIWLGWLYAQGGMVHNLLHPSAAMRAMSWKLRPFFAMNRALFSLYHDLSRMRQAMVAVNAVLAVAAVGAGFVYGRRRGGWIGGVLVGGLLAVLPMLLDLSLQSRPYSMAWSLGAMAACAVAIGSGRRRATVGAILLGLAIGSRIEMVLLVPLLLWELWDRPTPAERWWRAAGRMLAIAALTAYAVAPWLLTGLPGNLRAIATIQLANPSATRISFLDMLIDFAWSNGLGVAALLFLAAIPLLVRSGASASRQIVLVVLVVAIAASIFKTTGYGLHHHGSAVLVLVLGCAAAAAALAQRWPRMAWVAVAAALALPLAQSARRVAGMRGRPAAIASADWIDAHVPAGSVVYLDGPLKVPLPTTASADAIWNELMDPQAWRRKFLSGVQRFGLGGRGGGAPAADLPRALSEENLVQERGNARRWFILGSETSLPLPRYDVRPITTSPVFGVRDFPAAFAASGGVVLWRVGYDGPVPPGLGAPVAALANADGSPVQVFCSADVRPKLRGIER